jgi:hypothetical protein
MKPSEVISTPEKWTTLAFARDEGNRAVSACSEQACKWCLSGAVYRSLMCEMAVALSGINGWVCPLGGIDATLRRIAMKLPYPFTYKDDVPGSEVTPFVLKDGQPDAWICLARFNDCSTYETVINFLKGIGE